MSHGPGIIERRVAEYFKLTHPDSVASSDRDRALGVGEIAAYVFALNGRKATRAQRISTTRAA